MGILQVWILECVAMPSSRGISPSQKWNPGLPHCRLILYCLSHQENPKLFLFFFWLFVESLWLPTQSPYWLLLCSNFLFVHDSVLIGCIFWRIYLFFPGCPICSCIVVHYHLSSSSVFLWYHFFKKFLFLLYFTLQYCIGFAIHWHESTTGVPLGHPHAPAPSMLYPTSDIDWRFNSYMIVYMLECHSPKSSHPLPLPLSPKVRYTHLCVFCCLAYRVIIAIFLNSIYMC